MKWIKVSEREPNFNKFYFVGWYDNHNAFVTFCAYRITSGWFTRLGNIIADPDYYCNIENPK